jgi:hypothetical protein
VRQPDLTLRPVLFLGGMLVCSRRLPEDNGARDGILGRSVQISVPSTVLTARLPLRSVPSITRSERMFGRHDAHCRGEDVRKIRRAAATNHLAPSFLLASSVQKFSDSLAFRCGRRLTLLIIPSRQNSGEI